MNCPVTKFIDSKMQKFDPIWRAENGLGGQRSRYYDKTGVAKYREWRGVHDTLVDYGAWLKNLSAMVKMVASAPIPCLKGFWEYRWMGSYLGTFMFIDRLFEGYRGLELKIAHMHMYAIVQSLTKRIAYILSHDRRLGASEEKSSKLVPIDEVLPELFMTGFPDLYPVPLQTLPEFIICDIDQHIEPYYIDVAESFGLPADVCSRCAAETGVALDDAFPIVGKAVVTTNMPCNASEATSMFQRRRIGLPDYQATLAMIHNEPAALPFSRKVMEETIAFIEEHYDTKFNWKTFFKGAKRMNEQNQIELEKWDYFKTPYSPLVGIAETLYKLYEWQSVNGADPYYNKVDRRLPDLDAELLGHQHRPEHGLHDGPQHGQHRGSGHRHGRPDPPDREGLHASHGRRRLGQRQLRLGVGHELQLRHGAHERQHRLQGHARRARHDGRAGARPRLPLHLHRA